MIARVLGLMLALSVSAHASPKTLIDLNQFDMQYVKDLPKLKADWCMASVSATPELRGDVLNNVIKALKCRVVLTADGGIDPAQLLDTPNWTKTPRNLGTSQQLVIEAGVTVRYVMLYTEFNRSNQHSTLLTNKEYLYASSELHGTKILPLTRAWDILGRLKLIEAMKLPVKSFPGLYIEVVADTTYLRQVKVCEMIKYANKKGRFSIVLLSGKNPSFSYAEDVSKSCRYIKKACPKAIENSVFGVAVYEHPQKGINWIGGENSVSEAMRQLKRCLH